MTRHGLTDETMSKYEGCTHVAEGEEDTLEEGCGLVERLLEGLVQLVVELASVLAHVVTHTLEQDTTQENGRLFRLEVGDKDLGGGKGGVRGPVGRGGEREQTGPLGKGGKELEGLGKGSGTVAGEKLSDSATARRSDTVSTVESMPGTTS